MSVRLPVRLRSAREVVALHHPREPLANRCANDVDKLVHVKHPHVNLVADCRLLAVGEAKLAEVP